MEPGFTEVGGETERRTLIKGAVELIRFNGSLDGREPVEACETAAAAWSPEGVGPAAALGPEAAEEALITAAAALGAERLLSGTKGVWNKAVKKVKCVVY